MCRDEGLGFRIEALRVKGLGYRVKEGGLLDGS